MKTQQKWKSLGGQWSHDLKKGQQFEMEICLLRKDGGKGNISRHILLRN